MIMTKTTTTKMMMPRKLLFAVGGFCVKVASSNFGLVLSKSNNSFFVFSFFFHVESLFCFHFFCFVSSIFLDIVLKSGCYKSWYFEN